MQDSHFEDEAFVALRANDPAHSANDLATIRENVETPALHHHTVDKKRPSWLMPAAAAAVASLLIGSGAGYQLAASSASSNTDMSTAAVGPALGAPGTDTNYGMGGGRTGSQIAGASDKMMPGYFGGRAFLTPAASISDTSGSAVGYLMDDANVDRKALANAIAKAFDLKDVVKTQDGGYTLGDATGVSAYGYVGGTYDKMVSFNFGDNTKSPWNCPAMTGSSSGVAPAAGTSEATAVPAPDVTAVATPVPVPTTPACKAVSGTPLSDSAAIAIAKKLFTEIGLDNSAANYSVADASWFGQNADGQPIPFSHVIASITVDGLDTGMSWTADINPQGDIANVGGFMATFKATAAYDIVGAKTATLRSQDIHWSQFGPIEQWSGSPMPIAYASDVRVAGVGVNSSQPTVRLDDQGRPLVVESYEDITITSTQPALTSYYLADGRTALLPAYELHAGERTWLQIAIADKYLVH